MISPLTLNPSDRILVLAAHPDDETLGTGALLQRAVNAGAAVQVVFVTDGDNNPWPQRFLERRWKIQAADRARWAGRRRDEAKAALRQLGVDDGQADFWGFPDQGLSGLLERADTGLVDRLVSVIARWRPTLLASTSHDDLHPDHNALAVLLDMALARLPGHVTPPKVFGYAIHRKSAALPATSSLKLSDVELDAKRRALLCHATQMALSRRRFMRHVQAEERFTDSFPPDRFQPCHPVEETWVDETTLHVRLKLGRLERWLGGCDLSLIECRAQQGRSLRILLKGRRGKSDVLDAITGAVVGQAVIHQKGPMLSMLVPRSLLSGPGELFLKPRRRWGFLDYAGWRRVRMDTCDQRRKVESLSIIPCYNVQDFCSEVIHNTLHFSDHVILVDDGSRDATGKILATLAHSMPERISLITFAVNQGKGVGLMAGFCEALNRFDFGALVTLDADGQHPPARIPALVERIAAGAEMVIGERRIEQMPGRSKLGNTIISAILHMLFPQAPVDTQSGMRAFTPSMVREIVREVRGSRYETEFQILLMALAQQRAITSVPIPTIYIDNNRSSKFRPVADSFRILATLIRWRVHLSLSEGRDVVR